ncbi:MAG: restriction endonuclease subunit M [Kiritimatiellae bacterium]|nr:restriction endonuclease subunit M [Kiritimatiellia bacterium]
MGEREVIDPDFGRDVLESDMPRDVLDVLLLDRTTGRNILWMSDNYVQLESVFDAKMGMLDEIDACVISRPGSKIIRPRVDKSKAEQRERVQKKAEVFTPSWICNNMLNDVDAAWFGRKSSPFTTLGSRDERWKRCEVKVAFPGGEGQTWQDYVNERRLEMCCGEAPFLASRYDTTTGEVIPVPDRIGILDRKLRVVTENAGTAPAEWLKHAILALKATLGFEWQGDNLLIARENILYTILEHYKFYCSSEPLSHATLLELADIISWNIWQMDGLKCVVPMTCHDEPQAAKKHQQLALFDIQPPNPQGELPFLEPCPGCRCKKPLDGLFLHNGLYCNVMNWTKNKPHRYADIIRDNMERQRQREKAKP